MVKLLLLGFPIVLLVFQPWVLTDILVAAPIPAVKHIQVLQGFIAADRNTTKTINLLSHFIVPNPEAASGSSNRVFVGVCHISFIFLAQR